MPQRILIMGLPGAGKTTLAQELKQVLESKGNTVGWLNADEVRRYYNDWDFSIEGRLRQSIRMRDLADEVNTDYVIVDFVAPLVKMRDNFDPDWTIWVDTIAEGRFADTNALFVPPTDYSFRIKTQDAAHHATVIAQEIILNQVTIQV